jgi:predicted AlkP superfamily pyrophosphatase or phosphodiesterase
MRPAAALFPLAALTAAVTGVALFALSRPAPSGPEPQVRLAVLVVFDQLRGDYLERWQPLFGPDGFVRLQRDGAWFTNCHYPYATTTTGPGHASVLTGTCPDVHGIVDNNWIEGGKKVYCAGHPKYQLDPPVPEFPPDPEDKKKPAEDPPAPGTPERLLSETVADVLKRQTEGRAKVFGLSLKDRSAILPSGKRPNGAFWFYGGVFGTSTYYTKYTGDLPRWVDRFNASKVSNRWFGVDWLRLGPRYLYDASVGPDERPGEGKGTNQGIAFPHPTTGGRSAIGPRYYAALANSPFGNELLLEFAKTCVIEEHLGLHDVPDLLVVSFSSNDLIGHTWGPDSHEVMDVTLRSDAVVAELLAFLDRRVGKGRYVLGLTADHGVCPLPEVTSQKWRSEGRPDWQEARRVDTTQLRKALDAHLSSQFAPGKPTEWVDVAFPWFHLKAEVLQSRGLPRERVAAEAARFLADQAGVARTLTHAELMGTFPASDEIATRLKRSFHPDRSGDVGVVLKPYCIPGAALSTGTTHGAPYDYDTHVPLLVYGPGIRGGARDEPTTPQALASIFARWLNIPRPKDAAFPIPATLE